MAATDTQSQTRPRRSASHTPDCIEWDLPRTNWLHAVPLAFGTIPSSRAGHPAHRVCVRTDGTNPSCSCESRVPCTLEREGEAVARAFWAAWAASLSDDDLDQFGRDLNYTATCCGADLWQRHQIDALADEALIRLIAREAA